MSKWEKLLAKVCSLSNEVRFEELRKVLEAYGYEMLAPHGGGSHCTFRKAGCNPITIPRHAPVKRAYVEMVKRVVESEGVDEDAR